MDIKTKQTPLGRIGIVEPLVAMGQTQRAIAMAMQDSVQPLVVVQAPAPIQSEPDPEVFRSRGITALPPTRSLIEDHLSWSIHKQHKPNKGLRLGSYNSKKSKKTNQ